MAPGRRKRDREETPPVVSPTPEPSEPPTAPGSPSPPPITKRRRGRPPKNTYSTRNTSAAESPAMDIEDPSTPPAVSSPVTADSPATPAPSGRGGWRGRGRGRGRGSGLNSARGKNRGGPSHATIVPLDEFGNSQQVENDELVLEVDPLGEDKVDVDGNLLGGRDYRCRTFTLKDREPRQFMLSTEPARCIGFRDSYLFFQKHKNLFKIIVTEEEKFDMISRNLIPHSYKGRAIGVLTARSVFREFGSQIVIGGRKVIDDYYETRARERGDMEGELADKSDIIPVGGSGYNKNQYVAWHGASSVYHQAGSTVPEQNPRSTGIFGQQPRNRKKIIMTTENWMYEHAMAASNFNHILSLERRKAVRNGVYEPHTGLTFYPANLQPTSARWEYVSSSLPRPETPPPAVDQDGDVVPLTNGDARPKTYSRSVNTVVESHFISPAESFNFTPGIHDVEVYLDPPADSDDDPERQQMAKLINPFPWPGSSANAGIKDIDPSIFDHLDEDMKNLILEQQDKERKWDEKWSGGETGNGLRAKLKI